MSLPTCVRETWSGVADQSLSWRKLAGVRHRPEAWSTSRKRVQAEPDPYGNVPAGAATRGVWLRPKNAAKARTRSRAVPDPDRERGSGISN
jgi:hypothetical protein